MTTAHMIIITDRRALTGPHNKAEICKYHILMLHSRAPSSLVAADDAPPVNKVETPGRRAPPTSTRQRARRRAQISFIM